MCLLFPHVSCCVAGPAGERRLPGRVGSTGAAAESRAGSLQGSHEQRERSKTPTACSRTLLVHTLTLAFTWLQLLVLSVCIGAVLHFFSSYLSLITLLSTCNDRAAQTFFPACHFTAAIKCLNCILVELLHIRFFTKLLFWIYFQLFICHYL